MRYAPLVSLWTEKRKDYRFATTLFTYGSAALNLLFAGYQFYLWGMTDEGWFGAMGGYYIALGLSRYGILEARRRALADASERQGRRLREIRRSGGKVLLGLALFLLLAVRFALLPPGAAGKGGFGNEDAFRVRLTALYAGWRVVVAAVHVLRSARRLDPALAVLRRIGYADALVSVFFLGTTVLPAGAERFHTAALLTVLLTLLFLSAAPPA